MGASKTIKILILGGYAKLRPVKVSLPLVPCLLDMGNKYSLPTAPPEPVTGLDDPLRRRPRLASLRLPRPNQVTSFNCYNPFGSRTGNREQGAGVESRR